MGRLRGAAGFSRGTPVRVKLDVEARTLGFEVGGVDCGVAFRNVTTGAGLYPSLALADGAQVMVSKVQRL